MSKKIGDLIEVPEVKTVIQMSDIEDPELRDFLAGSFVVTEETGQVLYSVFNSIYHNEGKGFFLEGNYGSGKSHLLTVISLLLTYQQSWQSILEQEEANSLNPFYQEIINRSYLVINLSLVRYSQREHLEDIVVESIYRYLLNKDIKTEETQDFIQKLGTIIENNYDNYKRHLIFDKLIEVCRLEKYDGIVILIDELSEYLRSREDGRKFNEDIRFLQFISEFFNTHNHWIMATLQEGIEKTGEINNEAFGKIKDRFLTSFQLTGAHIREIVSQRLIKHKAGAGDEILNIYNYYHNGFEEWPVSRREFINLYPVNPLTINLLDNLKPLFSEQRGIIDFIHYRLRGEETRNIEGMLHEPAQELLNPDLIFDHFLNRIKKDAQTIPYYDKVYCYFKQEAPSILDNEQLEIGMRIVKLLILVSISPVEKKYSVKEIANMLLYRVTELEPSINYQLIDDILHSLYRHGAYLVLEEGGSVQENRYFINLKADIYLLIERKIENIKNTFFTEDTRIFTRLGKNIHEKYLPISSLLEQPNTVQSITWQNTERKGFRYCLRISEFSIEKILKIVELLQKNEPDFVLFIGFPLMVEKEEEYLKNVLLPELNGDVRGMFAFWLPQELGNKGYLKEVLARDLLLEEYENGTTETRELIKEKLQKMLDDDYRNIRDYFRDAYFNGRIIDGNDQDILNPEETGYPIFQDNIIEIARRILNKRFPKHMDISPYRSYITTDQIEKVREYFFINGEIEQNRSTELGLTLGIENYLKPMGLIKKKKNKITLNLHSGKNLLVKEFLTLLEDEKTPISDIYLKLRKGEYGICRNQFKILVLALLYSGYITAYSEKQKYSLTNLSVRSFNKIKYLGSGELVDVNFQEVLKECSLLPPRFKEQPFSLPLQQEIWDYLTGLKRNREEDLINLKKKITDLVIDEKLEYFNHENMLNYVQKVNQLFSEIKVSYSSEEGLERFAAEYRSLPNIDLYLKRVKRLEEFLHEHFTSYLNMSRYLKGIPNLPGGEKYQKIVVLKQNLLESLQEEELIYKKGLLDELQTKFKKFKKEYIELYTNDHQKKLATDSFRSYRHIKRSTAYKILSLLSDIDIISVKNDLIKVDRILGKVLKQECSQLNQYLLQQKPVCDCGFKIGDSIETVSLQDIHQIIFRGIKEYLKVLGNREYKKSLEQYINNMETVGKKKFARPLKNILNLLSVVTSSDGETETRESDENFNKKMIEKLDKNLNRNTISRINKALSEDMSLVERDLDQLYENLVGRNFSTEQIQQIFNDWLSGEGGLDHNTYIRVVSEENPSHDSPGKEIIEEFLTSYYPELLTVFEQLGEADFSYLLACKCWQYKYEIEDKDLKQLVSGTAQDLNKINVEKVMEIITHLFENDTEPEVRERLVSNIEEFLTEGNMIDNLFGFVPHNSTQEIIEALAKENLSSILMKKLLVSLIRQLEREMSLSRALKSEIEGLQKIIAEEKNNKYLSADKKLVLKLAINYLLLQYNLSVLSNREELNTGDEMTKLYCKYLAFLEYHYYQIENLTESLQLVSDVPLRAKYREVRKILNKYQKKYNDYYQSDFSIAESKDVFYNVDNVVPGPATLIVEKYPLLVQKFKKREGIGILLDGMRWDIWQMIKERLQEKLSLRIINEGSLTALPPANTETQLESIRNSAFKGEIIKPEDFNQENIKDRSSKTINKKEKEGLINKIIHFSYIDDKVHSSREKYADLMEEITFQTDNRLIPFIDRIQAKTPLLVFADHGFIINHNFKKAEKYETPRYLHGGHSIYEIIVPWALVYKL